MEPSPPWNLPFFTVDSTLSSPCSRSELRFSHQDVALAHLDSFAPHDLVLWTDNSVIFPFCKGGSGVPANCSLVVLKPLFPFQQAQYAQVFPLKPAPFCTLFAGLDSTNRSATSLLFSFYLTTALVSAPCPLLYLFFYLKRSGRSGRNCSLSPPVLSGYNGSPDTRFSWETTRLISWPYGERYLHPLQPLVVSLVLSLVSTLLFTQTGGFVFHLNSSTHRFSQFPPRNLYSFVTLVVFSFLFAATDTFNC